MDWLDEKFYKLSNWYRNLSLRKALTFYIIFSILLVILLSVITLAFCDHWNNLILSRYSDVYLEGHQNAIVYYKDYSKLTKTDNILIQLIELLQNWSAFLYAICGTIGVSRLFYQRKLKEPLEVLKRATKKVADNDLSVEIEYDMKDEMGDLCHSFEFMRKQLIANNQKMWEMMEEQKRLNAAFAHDLRTPLTVLRGYTDFLSQYVPTGKVDDKKLISTLSLMSNQIERLERYSNTMKEINSLGEIPVHPVPITVGKLRKKLEEVIQMLNGIQIKLTGSILDDTNIILDDTLLLEVFENLLSNALRYAKKEIEINLALSEEEKLFLLNVADDGKGFQMKDFSMATKPYYTDNSEDRTKHLGIGLYICKLLCEKHRGWLSVANRVSQGAIVTAAFSISDGTSDI